MILGDPLWSEMLSMVNIVSGLIIFSSAMMRSKWYKGTFRLLLRMMAIVGLYWACLYTFVLFTSGGSYDAVQFGRVFVRPMFTITLSAMASLGLYRLRKGA